MLHTRPNMPIAAMAGMRDSDRLYEMYDGIAVSLLRMPIIQ